MSASVSVQDVMDHFKPVPLTDAMYEAMNAARANVVLGSPLYSYAMTKVDFVFSENAETACAIVLPGKNLVVLGVDFFMNKLTDECERAFVLMHELDHIFFDHATRAKEQCMNPEIYGWAADYYVNMRVSGIWKDENGEIKRSERYANYFTFPKFGGLYDEKFFGLCVEEIYHKLLEDMPENLQKIVEIMAGRDASELSEDERNKIRKLGGNFDELPVNMTDGEVELEAQRQENMLTLQTAATIAEATKQIGDSEGMLIREIREMAKPVISWKDKIANMIQSSVRQRPTYKRPNSRTIPGRGPVLPSYDGMAVNVMYGFDTSGSMSQQDYAFVSGELRGIIEQFDAWRLHLACCDTAMTELGQYSSEEISDFEEIELKMHGGGGTNMAPLADYASRLFEEGEELNACIIVTDGYIQTDVLDQAFNPEMTNIVLVTSPEVTFTLKNAEVINVPRQQN